MRYSTSSLYSFLLFSVLILGCVDPYEPEVKSTVDVIVVDGTITNLPEPQTIRLNRSKADPVTGRFGTTPITKASVEVVVDSITVITFSETEAGRYQAPAGFRGQVGHKYQLIFTLGNGINRYESDTQIMHSVSPITAVNVRFNPISLSPVQQLKGGYSAAHDFYVETQDPPDQHNYYQWEWVDWERQEWCRSCQGGLYYVKDAKGDLIEDCVATNAPVPFVYDYNCRTVCWEIVYSSDLVLFDDQFNNGSLIKGLRVAQVPVYSKEHCLVEIRQSSLTATAYSYFKKLNEQTQKTGGVADTPASIPAGNVRNQTNQTEVVAGYFTASAVASQRYWLTRSDAIGFAPGLFAALNDGRLPVNEQSLARDRPPLAVCVPSDSRTPFKPIGWRD